MNVFLINKNSALSAKEFLAADPVRARKQLVECCQILSGAEHIRTGRCTMLKADGTPYRPTHLNHPCVTWCAASSMQWALTAGVAFDLAKVMPAHGCSLSLKPWISQAFKADKNCRPSGPSTDLGYVVVRRGVAHVVVHTLEEYASLMRRYLEDKGVRFSLQVTEHAQ